MNAPTLQRAHQLACEVRLRAHAPYSNFLVGAVVKAQDSDILAAGCNVENASYGATICAERNAILHLVAELGSLTLEGLVLVTDTQPAAMPCALCRQVMAEFATPTTEIHVGNLHGIERTVRFDELLPYPFSGRDLP